MDIKKNCYQYLMLTQISPNEANRMILDDKFGIKPYQI